MDTDTMGAIAAATLTKPKRRNGGDCLRSLIDAGFFARGKKYVPRAQSDRERRIG